jgi:hypothetical protein
MRKYIVLLFVLFSIPAFENALGQTQISGSLTAVVSEDLIRSSGINAIIKGSGPITAPLKSLSTNPNYFTDGTGKAVYLTGSHSWNTLQDWGSNDSIQPIDFTAFVDMLVSHHHNFTLLWTTELPTFRFHHFHELSKTKDAPPDLFSATPFPWERTGPGKSSDGKPKFDLTKFNQAYFDRLRARVMELNAAAIYAGVYLFSAEWLNIFRLSTDGFPFSGTNNINGIDDGGGIKAIAMTSPNKITDIQDAYVRKMINTVNDLPNVLWIVSQEAPSESVWWNNHMISLVRTYETSKPMQHPIGYGSLIGMNNDSVITNSDADWIAPMSKISPTITIGTGNPARKVNINDSDHSYWEIWKDSPQTNRNYFWINFTQGNQTLFMDPYLVYYPRENRNLPDSPANGIGKKPDIRWENVRNTMGYIREYADRMNLAAMTPQNNLSSTGHVLANTRQPNPELLVYAPSGGLFTVNLSGLKGKFTVEWMNPATGIKTAAENLNGDGVRSLTPPFNGDAVLYLRQ